MGPQQNEAMAAAPPPTADQLTLEDLQLMQQMGLTLPDIDSPRGIRIPVEPGKLLMGNGPLPIQAEEEGEGYVIINEDEEEEEEEEEEDPQTETQESN